MSNGAMGLADDSKALNSRVITLPRLLLLSVLDELPEGEGAMYRELKAGLKMNDGILLANIRALIKMEYIVQKKEKFENDKMTAYYITPSGREEIRRVKAWAAKWGGDNGGLGQGNSVLSGTGNKAKS